MNLFDSLDFGDFFTNGSFDAVVEGDGAGGAADALAMQADACDAFLGDFDEFDVAVIALDSGPDAVKHDLHTLKEGLVFIRGCCGQLRHYSPFTVE